jgi:hypothetical protein
VNGIRKTADIGSFLQTKEELMGDDLVSEVVYENGGVPKVRHNNPIYSGLRLILEAVCRQRYAELTFGE